jgi:hypothetical protein
MMTSKLEQEMERRADAEKTSKAAAEKAEDPPPAKLTGGH